MPNDFNLILKIEAFRSFVSIPNSNDLRFVMPSLRRKNRIMDPFGLATCFVSQVTEKTDADDCWIAKDGENGLFAVFAQILPQVGTGKK